MKYILHCSGIKLARKDGLFGKSDPFVLIKSYGKPIGFSNVVSKNLNPFWDPIVVDPESCGGVNGNITVEVFDFDNDGNHDFIGSFSLTLSSLLSGLGTKHVLINDSMKK